MNNLQQEKTDLNLQDYIKEGQRGLARLCRKLYHDDFIFNHTNGVWHIYENGRWKPDLLQQVRKYVSGGLYGILEPELVKVQEMYEDADKDGKNALKPILEETSQAVRGLNYKTYIQAVLELASSELPAHESMFDTNPYLFICGNGVYDLKNQAFDKHRPQFLISKSPSCDYDDKAQCPNWERFIEMIFMEDKQLIDYVQRAVGYSISGLKDFQGFFFCFGHGANGKSTFFNVLKLLLQDYYQTIPIDSLLAKNAQGTDYHIATLKGSRLVVSSEIPEGKSLNESLIKDLTGGDTITARHIYGKPFQFEPTHKLWMFGNHKPIIKGDDHGIWRRVHLIPFEYKFESEARRDMDEVIEEFKAELPGILNWCIEGFNKFMESGLTAPEVVNNHVMEYKKELNSIASWYEERAERGETDTEFSELYGDYQAYCEDTGAFQLSKKRMSAYLKDAGFDVVAGAGNKRVVLRCGIKGGAIISKNLPF